MSPGIGRSGFRLSVLTCSFLSHLVCFWSDGFGVLVDGRAEFVVFGNLPMFEAFDTPGHWSPQINLNEAFDFFSIGYYNYVKCNAN